MHSLTERNLQLLISSEDEERVLFGLNLALAAAASGVHVVVFFALRSARWVCSAHGDSRAITELLEQLGGYEVPVHCCSACAHDHCQPKGQESALLDGVRHAGLASLAQRASETHPTITL